MKSHTKKRPVKSKRKRKAPQARYEAAGFQWFDRSWLPAATQDARFDADASTRLELVRRARYWERNNAIVNRLADVFEQYSVGPSGLQVIPSTSDEGFNESAAQWWADWCKWPCVDNNLPMAIIQTVMARTWFVDGEAFVYKTFSPQSGRPRIQLIEGHRFGTPPSMRGEEGRSIVDGIEYQPDNDNQPSGRPYRYWMRTDSVAFQQNLFGPMTGKESWRPIEGGRLIHLYEPTRPGMPRGIPFLYPVMNDLHDLDDLQVLEMKAAKANADVANVVTTKTGEASLAAARRQKWQIQSQDKDGNPTNKGAPMFYEVALGGRSVFVQSGEKFEQFKSDRPSVATKDYWDYLVRKICAGVGISALLVLPFSLQGTVTRADLDVAAAFFRARSSIVAAVLREIYLWAISWAVKYDRALDGAPSDWFRCVVRPPRSVTVDVGRNSQAILEELEAGVRTFQDVCGEMGHDWRQMLRQKAKEAQFINQLVDEFGVTRDQISQLAKGTFSVKETIEPSRQAEETLEPGRSETKKQHDKELQNQLAIKLEDNRTSMFGWDVIRDDKGAILRYERRPA